MLKLGIVVEGKGDSGAVGSLVTKVLRYLELDEWIVATVVPAKGSGNLDREDRGVEHYVTIAAEGKNAVLVLRDSDGQHPPDIAMRYAGRLRSKCGFVTIAVCVPHKEFENWLLASLESIRGRPWGKEPGIVPDAPVPVSPEGEDAKGYFTQFREVSSRYKPAIHQQLITRHFNPGLCMNSCSFEVLCRRLTQIDSAVRAGNKSVFPNG